MPREPVESMRSPGIQANFSLRSGFAVPGQTMRLTTLILALAPLANAQRRGFAHHHGPHSSVATKRSIARSLSLGSTNRSSPARPSRAVADAPPPARPHISWSLPEHKSYLQTSQTHVAVVQRISLPPPDE